MLTQEQAQRMSDQTLVREHGVACMDGNEMDNRAVIVVLERELLDRLAAFRELQRRK